MRTFLVTMLVCVLAVLNGCGAGAPMPLVADPALAGNWSIASSSAPGSMAQVASVGGALSVSSGSVSGVLHTIPVTGQSAAALCVPPSTAIAVSGALAAGNVLTLQSSAFNGNTLQVSGVYTPATASTQASLNDATYSITGPCGVTARPAQAVWVNAINGTYTGSFLSASGSSIAVSATLTQTTQPDSNGTYHLQGNATFPYDI